MKEPNFERSSMEQASSVPEFDNKFTDELFDRSAHAILLEAKSAWEDIEHYRNNRKRCRDYTFGKQWGDSITLPDGRTMSEESYLKEQGKVPLKNNVIRRLVKNVVGQYRSTQTDSICIARNRSEQPLGELATTALQYIYQHNNLKELDGRTIEEFLISGSCFHKIVFGRRKNKADVWIDNINPNRIFFNAMEDSRLWDCNLIGEIHDISIADVLELFANGSRVRAARLREIYSQATEAHLARSFENLTTQKLDRLDFLLPSDTHLCRVIEVWKMESKERIKCHDTLTGEYYKVDIEELPLLEEENERRLQLYTKNKADSDEIPLIQMDWFIDKFWQYRYFTPFGDVLATGETPFWHGEHPYAIKLYPLIDGEVHSFVDDIIDQQRYINRLITLVDFIMGSSAKGVLLFPENQIPDGMSIESISDEWTRYNGVIIFKPRPGEPLPQQISVNATNIGAYELLNLQMKLVDEISGVNGALQGQNVSPNMAASLYNQQSLNASVNLVDIFESFKSFREGRDVKIIKTMQQYYTQEHLDEMIDDSTSDIWKMRSPEQVKNMEFDLSIAHTLTSPAYRMESNNFLLELFRMGKIDLEMFLQNSSFPFSDKLLEQLKNKTDLPPELPLSPQEITTEKQPS